MSRSKEKIFLFVSDFIFINAAWALYYWFRVVSGWIPYANPTAFIVPLIVIYIYWIILFGFSGLYQHWYIRSRFDEFASVVKAVSIGCLILFFLIFIDDLRTNSQIISRFLILIYWSLMIIAVSFGRILIRSFQMNLLQKGIGLRNTLIIGTGNRAKDLSEIIKRYPQLGYNILGFIAVNNQFDSTAIGGLNDISGIIDELGVTEVLIALEPDQRDQTLKVLEINSQEKIHLKIMPDTYEIVSGMVKTNQIYGVPLIDVMPELLSYSSKLIKRFMDLFIAISVLILLFPILFICAVLIIVTSRGDVLYKQTRVGKNGKLFYIYKFRSMYSNAEKSGPEWAGKNDPRVTKIGKLLRKTHLDEVPQMLNVIKNEMSIVGPRPERPYFVEIFKKEIPYYYKRLSVKPGITGWAQVKHKYDATLDDVKTKLQYDFFYIENMSIKLDLKILINTLFTIIFLKGH